MAITNQHDRKIRAQALVKKIVLEGKTHVEAGRELGISHDTVSRDLQWFREAGLFLEYEQKMFDELLPRAHDAIKMALEDGDAQVGLKIFEAVGLMRKGNSKSQSAENQEEGLYAAIEQLRSGNVITIPHRTIESPTSKEFIENGDILVGPIHRAEEGAEGQSESSGETSLLSVEDGTGDSVV